MRDSSIKRNEKFETGENWSGSRIWFGIVLSICSHLFMRLSRQQNIGAGLFASFHAHLCSKKSSLYVCAIILIHVGFIEFGLTSFLRTRITGTQKRIKPVKFFEAGCCSRFFSPSIYLSFILFPFIP